MTALLGIDLGTGSVKALIVDEHGRTLGHAGAEYPLHHPKPGWAEQDPADWWRATVLTVRQAHAQAGNCRIDAIGLSGQMHGTVLIDGDRHPVRPAIIWADTRSGDDVAAITERIGAQRLIDIAGSPIATGFQAASVAWVRRIEPSLWSRVRTILLPKDYLRLLLTGELRSEPSDASSTLLFDVEAREWSKEICSALGVERSQLPAIVPSNAISGTLTTSAATELGLDAGTPVAGGGADAPLAALAAGVAHDNQMALTISTGSQVIAPSNSLRRDPAGRIHAWCNCLSPGSAGAAWYQMGATMVSGLALRWLRDAVFALEIAGAYEAMTSWAAATSPGAGGLIFLPYLTGERTPHMDPNARGMFLGLTADHGRGHLVRAVMEGATLALFDAFDVLRSLGANPSTIVLCGGGAQSEPWRQIVADVFRLPLRPLLTVEQSALGATMLAGGAIGAIDPVAAATTWPTYGEPVEPRPGTHDIYATILPIFRDAYQKHRSDFVALGQLSA